MNKKQIAVLSLVVSMALVMCAPKKEVLYNFPPSMQEPVLSEYVKLFDKGKILFDINCAKCHNIKTKRKEIYPDFSQDELAGYDLRILNPNHEDELTERTVTEEELAIIKTFLAYKKKSNVPVKKHP